MFYRQLYCIVFFCCLTSGLINLVSAKEDTNFKSGKNYESKNQYEQALRHYLDATLAYTAADDQENLFLVNKTIGLMCAKWGRLRKIGCLSWKGTRHL